jgi:hypothetical protein
VVVLYSEVDSRVWPGARRQDSAGVPASATGQGPVDLSWGATGELRSKAHGRRGSACARERISDALPTGVAQAAALYLVDQAAELTRLRTAGPGVEKRQSPGCPAVRRR